jgi:undecaprenyl-diphosphatase
MDANVGGVLVTFELIKDTIQLTLIVAFLYFALGVYLGWKQPAWSAFAEKRRFAILVTLVLIVLAIKVSEDAVNRESGPFDVLVLQFIHANVPPTLSGIFRAATITASASVLSPLVIIMVVALLYAKRRFEALLLAASVISAGIIVYVLKAVVGLPRPDLWDTEWYWGSSFPSGHTLVVAALATATVIGVSRIWPGLRNFAMLIAFLWVFSVGLSRLVLGVHWPTDVLAAICIGMFLPLAIGIALESWRA